MSKILTTLLLKIFQISIGAAVPQVMHVLTLFQRNLTFFTSVLEQMSRRGKIRKSTIQFSDENIAQLEDMHIFITALFSFSSYCSLN